MVGGMVERRTEDGGGPSERKVRSNPYPSTRTCSYIPSVLSRPSRKSNHSSLGLFFLVIEQDFPSSLASNLSIDQPKAASPRPPSSDPVEIWMIAIPAGKHVLGTVGECSIRLRSIVSLQERESCQRSCARRTRGRGRRERRAGEKA